MADKRYYWLKLVEDYFNSPKIKKLRIMKVKIKKLIIQYKTQELVKLLTMIS